MIDLGISTADRRLYELGLAQSRPAYSRVFRLDQDEKPVEELTGEKSWIVGGSVQFDADAQITRSLQVHILDPTGRLYLEPASPSASALMPDNFISVSRGDYVNALGRFQECPVGRFVVTAFDRRGYIVSVNALGKESLFLEPHFLGAVKTFRKGTKITEVIRDLLGSRGERQFDIPEIGKRLRRDLSVGRYQEPWKVVKQLVRSLSGRQVFYDGRGRVRIRTNSADPVFAFTDGEDGVVKTRPQASWDFTEVRNRVDLLGGFPRGSRKRVRYSALPPRADPLSPWSLGRDGKPRFILEVIEDSEITKKSEAKTHAERRLRLSMLAAQTIEFDCLPVPHLEENDIVRLMTLDGDLRFQMKRWSLPLAPFEAMAVGTLRRPKIRKPA